MSSSVGGVRSTKPHCQPCPQCWEAKRQSLAGTQRASGLAVIGAGKQLPQGPDLIQGAEGGGSVGGLALRGGAPRQSTSPSFPPSYLPEPLLSSHLTIPLSSELRTTKDADLPLKALFTLGSGLSPPPLPTPRTKYSRPNTHI